MVKMIISAPHGYDVEQFMNLTSEISRARYGNDYDLDLGDYISPRIGSTVYLDEYELDAEDITLEQVYIIVELQALYSLLNIHFEEVAA